MIVVSSKTEPETSVLRDWLAGQALNGIVASDSTMAPDWYAHQAYRIADAMLEERAKA